MCETLPGKAMPGFGWELQFILLFVISKLTMSNEAPQNNESTAAARLENLVAAWNNASFDAYCANFTQHLVDHYNPAYFARIRHQGGQWLANQYLGCLKQGANLVHLWRSRFEYSSNDVLFSLTLTEEGKIAGLLKRFSRV
jgi:hypothetical protein